METILAQQLEVKAEGEALHFDRGYQHLLRGKQGGWILPGQASGFGPASQQSSNTIYDTNIYTGKGDIICTSLAREVPAVEFFPMDPDYGPDIVAAAEADNFKEIYARNNKLQELIAQCARIFWNEDRILAWTRYELNGQLYGFEDDSPEEAPVVPEDLLNPPDDTPTGQEGLDDFLQQVESPEEEETTEVQAEGDDEGMQVQVSSQRKPRGQEVTTMHGKMDHKCPIAVDAIKDMQSVQLYLDLDVAIVKATFPWIADKIKPGSDGNSEVELDRIGRENTRQAVLGAYVTGDSLQRHTVVKYTWFRPSMFMDDSVNDLTRAELLEAFPNGCLLAKAGANYAFSRNESMDKHLAIAHCKAGKGQNRMALGSALISIQKRINDWVDLQDDFFKRTVPKKWFNAEAFDMEAMKDQTNVPGSSGQFEPQPGLTTMDQYIMLEPTPQPQAAMAEMIKWFITTLSEDISGALPSLFGAATGENTVGNAQIQRDQALQRIGSPWNALQTLFAETTRQAVGCAADCREGKRLSMSMGAGKVVRVNTSNLNGNVLCYPESDPSFPESSAQREAKLMGMVDTSTSNQALQQFIFSPSNLPVLQSGLRLKAFKVPGAVSMNKQKMEREVLLRSGPTQNPAVLQLQKVLDQASEEMGPKIQQGLPADPKEMAMLTQLQAQLKALPPLVSTVPVAQDESENHVLEAAEQFAWLNDIEGQKFKAGNPQQKAAYQNNWLHWKEHTAMAKQIAKANAPPPENKPPSESITAAVDKVPQNVAIQLLAKMGVQSTAQDFQQHAADQLQQKVQAKAIPEALKGEKPAPPQAPPQQGGEQPRQLRR
jgi:hypothetical protein